MRKNAADWIGEALGKGEKFGVDPWLHTEQQLEVLRKAVTKAGGSPILLDENPVDAVWVDRLAELAAPMLPHPIAYAGKRSEEKRAEIAEVLKDAEIDALLVSSAESIALLLNVRGTDVSNTPLCLCFADILFADGTLALHRHQNRVDILAHLGSSVTVHPQGELGAALDRLAREGRTISIDPASAPVWAMERVRKADGTVSRLQT